MTTPPPRSPSHPLPQELTSPVEKLVYLYLRERDGATVHALRDALDIPQLRLYPTIDRLAKRDLVERNGDDVVIPDGAIAGEVLGARA